MHGKNLMTITCIGVLDNYQKQIGKIWYESDDKSDAELKNYLLKRKKIVK